MKFWYHDELLKETLCIILKSEITLDLIIIQFLRHYIENSNLNSLRSWNLMLINSYDNYNFWIYQADK